MMRATVRVGRMGRACIRFTAVVSAVGLGGPASLSLPQVARATVAGCQNPVACENRLAGTPQSQWDINPISGTDNIRGFPTDESVEHGSTINFKINTDATNYHLAIYRMGYYRGDGARLVGTISPAVALPQVQPACLADTSTGLVDCGNWGVSASWAVPATAVSGIYFADAVRDDGTFGESQISFVVRDDEHLSDVVLQNSDETEQAYNPYGGNSLYGGTTGPGPKHRAYAVSYNRPVVADTPNRRPRTIFSFEYPMIRWLEANGYDVSYIAGVDTDRFGGTLLPKHKLFLSVGHDEYVSGNQRVNIDAAAAHGVSLGYLSGDEIYWKTRWQSSIDGSNTADRTLVCYKETTAVIDPSGFWTGHWGDSRFSPPLDAGPPPNATSGQQSWVINMDKPSAYPIVVPSQYSQLRFWRNTAVAGLAPGLSATLTNGIIGYEWDIDNDNGYRPPGLMDLSSTTIQHEAVQNLSTWGYNWGTAIHHLTLYKMKSGALVFGAGTVQWSWALDGTHDGSPNTPDRSLRQATVNLFADMGVQPTSLRSGLVSASASTDVTAPTSSVTSPPSGSTVTVRTVTTVSVAASDAGGGVVAGVEVSVDGGTTWHPATGSGPWQYAWTPSTDGTVIVMSRSVDDSGNLESPSSGVSVTVVG